MRCAAVTASIAATAWSHGALLDAQLLSQVYVELTGGRQIGLTLVTETIEVQTSFAAVAAPAIVRPARLFEASAEELARHAAFMEKIKNPLWGSRRPVDAGTGPGLAVWSY